MLKRLSAAVLFLLLCIQGAVEAQAPQPLHFRLNYTTVHGGLKTVASLPDSAPRLGLALAGGGARAAASVGVLKVLAREGIPVSAIAGTSMGAGVGGLFAAGYRPDEIEAILLANDWNDVFRDAPVRAFLTQEQKESGSRYLLEFTFRDNKLSNPTGLSAGQKLMNLLAAKTLAASFEADLDFDRLRIPFRAVATDIETGEPVVLSQGLLHDAIRASMAIPVVFQPVEIGGRLLVDGGLVNNLPVDVVRDLGARVVIAVDASAKLEKKEHLSSLVDIMSQSISMQVRRESERQAAQADLVIRPDTEDFSFADFPQIQAIIKRGEEAAEAALPRIRELLKPESGMQAGREHYRITSLVIRGAQTVSEEAIRNAMAALAPREATAGDLRKTLTDVFRLGFFSDVTLDLEQEGEGYRAVLTVAENPVVRTIAISGNTVLRTDEIAETLAWQKDAPLNSTRLATQLDRIVERYRSQGYLLARVERTALASDGTLAVVFYEGRVDSITMTGNAKTSRALIRRETQTRAGQPLNFDTAAYDIQHLYALDYFDSLSVDMKKSQQGGVDVTLKIKEKPSNRIRLGLRYDLEDSFTGLTDIVVDNVGGRGVKLFLNTRYGNYTDLALGYRSPAVLRMNFVHTVEGLYQKRDYAIYEDKQKVRELDITRTGAEFAFGYQWFRFGDTYLRYRYVSDTTEETPGPGLLKEISRIGSLAFLSTMDTRDSSTFAHRGTLFKVSYESAARAYGGNSEYTKTSVYAQGFAPLAERHTVVLEATAGLGSGTLPYEEKYGIGGADYLISTPLLGFQRREFVGDNLLDISAAYRWKLGDYQLNIVKALYLNFAYQAANVWDGRDAMSFSDLRSGGGVGLYADTVVGPVRLDVGAGEGHRRAIYFSVGFDF